MIKKYLDFISESKESIESICKKYGIENYNINDDGTVDVDGYVNLNSLNLSKLPLKFGRVTGNFYCSNNQLTSLEGAPKEVVVFYCNNNRLTTLKGAPKEVNGLHCRSNYLESLVEGPKIIRGDFFCSNNKLTTLVGGPEVVTGAYDVQNNKLVNFKGFPDYHDSKFMFSGNPVYKILERFPFKLRSKAIYWINEYDAIDDEGNVSELLMEEVFHELKLHYQIIFY